MQRLTTRLLLLVVVVGMFEPLLEAFSPEPAHACCLRRLHVRATRTEFHDASKHGGNCCPPLTTPHTAQVRVGDDRVSGYHSLQYVQTLKRDRADRGFTGNYSSRAPPFSSAV